MGCLRPRNRVQEKDSGKEVPPKPVSAGTRANEGVSCEICHHITGTTEKEPFNFSYTIEPGATKQGRMTICQWYTAENTKVDYRIGPRETKIEEYSWTVPENIPAGELVFKARLLYSQVPSSVGEFLKLPPEEYKPILVNEAAIKAVVEK